MINSLSCTTLTVVFYVRMSSIVMLVATLRLTHMVPVDTGKKIQLPHDQQPFRYNFDCSFLCKHELNSHVDCNFNTQGTSSYRTLFFQLPHDQQPFMYNFDCSFLCKHELNRHVGCNFKFNTHGTC